MSQTQVLEYMHEKYRKANGDATNTLCGIPKQVRRIIYVHLVRDLRLVYTGTTSGSTAALAIRFVCKQTYWETQMAVFSRYAELDITDAIDLGTRSYSIDLARRTLIRNIVIHDFVALADNTGVLPVGFPSLRKLIFSYGRSCCLRYQKVNDMANFQQEKKNWIRSKRWRILGDNDRTRPMQRPKPGLQNLIDAWRARGRTFKLIAENTVWVAGQQIGVSAMTKVTGV